MRGVEQLLCWCGVQAVQHSAPERDFVVFGLFRARFCEKWFAEGEPAE